MEGSNRLRCRVAATSPEASMMRREGTSGTAESDSATRLGAPEEAGSSPGLLAR